MNRHNLEINTTLPNNTHQIACTCTCSPRDLDAVLDDWITTYTVPASHHPRSRTPLHNQNTNNTNNNNKPLSRATPYNRHSAQRYAYKIDTMSHTLERSPAKRAAGITQREKQALVDDLQLESESCCVKRHVGTSDASSHREGA